MTFGWFGNGDPTIGAGPGVPRREVGWPLKKSAGMSFQSVMDFAAEGGGAAGPLVEPLCGGGASDGGCEDWVGAL